MIRTIAAWIGLGVVLAIALEVVEAPLLVRLAVFAVYAAVAGPVVYRRVVAAIAEKRRWKR